MALTWHLTLAISSPLRDQQLISANVVALMTEGNSESIRLLSRMLPREFVRVLKSADAIKGSAPQG